MKKDVKSNPKKKAPAPLKDMDAEIIASGQIEEWLDECFSLKTGDHYGRISASVSLHMIISQMAEVYPAVTRENPDGTVWDGLALPERVLAYSKHEDRGRMELCRGNLLDIAAERGATDDAIRILIASGFDPGKFSSRIGMTPIGKAAFDGNVSTLRLFAQAGFDLSLPMKREHTGDSGLVGSNLLHRLMAKSGIDSRDGLEVVEVLLASGVDPLASNDDGQTPFEMAHGNIRVAMEKWLARNQSVALESGVDQPRADGETPKPRF